MSILVKPYEISVWEDWWDSETGRFVEKRLGIIGSDKMTAQCRALTPKFTKNVNGVKKLTFQMYKHYVDNLTGEKTENPFISWLISERKVKLYYEEEWHDFIIKNISEPSSNYLYTYQLEDALVQELSKNGFNVALDAKLMNNMGTANELAAEVLKETDWTVSNDSEAFVQTIDEALVYLTLPQNLSGIPIYHIIDQSDLTEGITVTEVTSEKNEMKGKTILAFYSSCTNKPHRFQFIYVPNLANLKKDEDRYIKNDSCQYYIDFSNPETDYGLYDPNGLKLYLPSGFTTTTVSENNVGVVTLSALYRGKRYGFSQQAKYIPILDRYVNLYEGPEYEDETSGKKLTTYYGYEHVNYASPALTQNVISNTKFESTSGWVGTHNGESGAKKAKVEAVYGYFLSGGAFQSSIDDLKNGQFSLDKNYKPYLKVTFPNDKSRLINSGPFDNRTVIENMSKGDKWAARLVVIGGSPTLSLGEYVYKSGLDGYGAKDSPKITFSEPSDKSQNGKTYKIFEVDESPYSKEQFKKDMQVRVCIAPPANVTNATYYIEEIELFRAIFSGETIITPDSQADDLTNRVMDRTYYYFKPSTIENITSADQLVPDVISKTLSYSTYKPYYNPGAQKVRSVTAKESNYFNILQSIAETFEAWLIFKITRNSDTGAITKKEIAFKNYVGGDNYAGFRYGVNLKDIQRTYESKNIVTKLIVKQNSNELAENGFCTISRANANPIGENCIYDFQYFFNMGLLNADDYLNTMYVINGAKGGDVGTAPNANGEVEYNLQGYFPRIRAINKEIEEESELLINTAKDLTQYKAEYEVADAGYKAANSGIQQVREDFESLIGVPIDYINPNLITSVEFNSQYNADKGTAETNFGYYYSKPTWLSSLSLTYSNKVFSASGVATNSDSKERYVYISAFPKITIGGITKVIEQIILCTFPANSTEGTGTTNLGIADTSRSDVTKLLKEYSVYTINEQNYLAEKEEAEQHKDETQEAYDSIQNTINGYKKYKEALNQKFFQQYSSFIQEGTWISEEYADDEKYYADALSVMYNSCYPQVVYSINVLELSQLPGYENFIFSLGEKTYVEDPDFFGTDKKEEIIITEISEVLDNPSKNEIKVQNFKNQFQDLFQKITATVQQAQYRTGSYEKAVALAEASDKRKNAFLIDALNFADAKLQAAGQQSVTWGDDGITVKSVDSPADAIRMVGGAILLSKQDENGEQKWVTGVTSDGVSASLITAGILNAGEISIMNYDQPLFRWDSFGISAYDATWFSDNQATVISGVDTQKFVRFDKNGIYGINHGGVDGANWYPADIEEIDSRATFALTWDGLKVTNSNGVVLHIGDGAKTNSGNTNLLDVRQGASSVFAIREDGSLIWGAGAAATQAVYATSVSGTAPIKPANGTGYDKFPDSVSDDNPYGWHKNVSVTDNYISYTYDGGITWGAPIRVVGESTYSIQLSDTFVPVTASSNGTISSNWSCNISVLIKNGLENRSIFYDVTGNYYYFGTAVDKEEGRITLEYEDSEIQYTRHPLPEVPTEGTLSNYEIEYFTFSGLAVNTASVTFKLLPKPSISTTVYAQASVSFAKQIKGDTGYVYRLELSDTFTLVTATNLGEVSTGSISVQPAAFYGPDEVDYVNYSNGVAQLVVEATCSSSQIRVTPGTGENPNYTISWGPNWLDGEKATVEFKLLLNGVIKDTKTFEIIKQKGNFGAVQCYIESSKGTVFEENDNTTTDLTARIFEGTREIDPLGVTQTLTYTWYNSKYPNDTWQTGKKLTEISISEIHNQEVYFIASSQAES